MLTFVRLRRGQKLNFIQTNLSRRHDPLNFRLHAPVSLAYS